jgi:DeoR family transcriptional regulator of aga operon
VVVENNLPLTKTSYVILHSIVWLPHRGLGKICNPDQVDYIITDKGVSPETASRIEKTGVQVLIAG